MKTKTKRQQPIAKLTVNGLGKMRSAQVKQFVRWLDDIANSLDRTGAQRAYTDGRFTARLMPHKKTSRKAKR